ncbi:MAG: hypothetical protein P1V97_37885 [Planctomycetota bacterium]|nr:hypothetical protein [Planctomycetota bacterium]
MTRKTQDKWLALIRQFQSSTLSLNAFADQQGLNPNTFRNYYYRLRHLVEEPLSFLPVVLETSNPFLNHSVVSIQLPGPITLQLSTLPSPEYLKELVVALREV